MATNPSLEGEATALYVQGQLTPRGVTVSRIARGCRSVAIWSTPTG